MRIKNSTTQYGAGPQLIHWLTALFVIAVWLLGQFGDDLPKGPARAFGQFTHMTLGECIVALLVVRLGWRIVNPPPPRQSMPLGRIAEAAAALGHYALYALLFAVPAIGIVVQMKRGHELPVFGFWTVASPWPADRAIAKLLLGFHKYFADALLILAGGHAGAALVHHWLWRDRTLARMLPGAA